MLADHLPVDEDNKDIIRASISALQEEDNLLTDSQKKYKIALEFLNSICLT